MREKGQYKILIFAYTVLYYLDNDDKPVFAISAGTFAKGGYLSTMKFYKDGTIYCQQFQRMRPEAKAETYEIKDGAFNQLQSVDFSMSETKPDGASKVGLGDAQTLDLSSEDWHDFDDSSSDETEASSTRQQIKQRDWYGYQCYSEW